jgi:transposase
MRAFEKETVGLPPVAFATGTPARSETQLVGAKGRPTMRNVALDLGNRITYARAENGAVVERAVVEGLHELERQLGKGSARARVAIEACREAWHVHDTLVSWGHEVLLVDTTRVREVGIGRHNRKNDRIDAERLALALEKDNIPRAHLLSPHRRKLRELLGVRRSLTQARATFVIEVRGICRAHGVRLPKCETETFAKVARAALRDEVKEIVSPILDALDLLTPRISTVDVRLEAASAEESAAARLQTVPGVGPVVAAAFISVIDDPTRFDHAHQVQSYLGLVPSEFTSGKRKLGSITKHGNTYLRSLLVQAAWGMLRTRASSPLKTWAQAVQRRRGKNVGAVALARRLAGVLWAIWYEGTVYDSQRVGAQSEKGLREQAEKTVRVAERVGRAARGDAHP